MTTKYRAQRTNGYASKKEAKRAAELKLLEQAGAISGLREQVRFELIAKQEGERPVTYVADFTYVENGTCIVEDCKGFKTREYIIKRKLMLMVHSLKIRES